MVGLAKEDVMSAFYRLLHPRPAVLVTCVDREGRPNAIAVSWITPVAREPPTIAICVAKKRYSHGLIAETGEFVVNIPSDELVEAVHFCGTVSGRDVEDKIAKAGLTARPAKVVRAPIIEECPAHIECRVVQVVDCGSHDIFIGQVVAAYADPGAFEGGFWKLEAVRPLLHAGGNAYSRPEPTFKAKGRP
ncbi:MAG TPA: flavin reductase family protein [Candidatus Bathyarchaeota archaeon]|nr:flavin reductase family protein [Candidatus Bathyarchaeota archaeon]